MLEDSLGRQQQVIAEHWDMSSRTLITNNAKIRKELSVATQQTADAATKLAEVQEENLKLKKLP